MFLLDLLVDLIINALQFLGFGTPQRKINSIMDKAGKINIEASQLYYRNQEKFENDNFISSKVFKLNYKDKESIDNFVTEITEYLAKKNQYDS